MQLYKLLKPWMYHQTEFAIDNYSIDSESLFKSACL